MEKHVDLEESPERTAVPSTYVRPQERRLYDPAVQFEEYHYYALKTREEQAALPAPRTSWREVLLRKKVPYDGQAAVEGDIGHGATDGHDGDDKQHRSNSLTINLANRDNRIAISDKEWTDASRAFRTASWGAVFYLITTDVLGPYGMGFTLSTTGWGPGIGLIVAFGLCAGYSGWQLSRTFLGLDSLEFPLKNYGDLAYRVFGQTFRLIVNITQALGVILILGQITLLNGQSISQIAKNRLCYAVCPVLFIAVGFLLGQIRTLRNYGWVANLAVWLNVTVMVISMCVIGTTAPNYAISVLGSGGSAVDPDSIAPVDGVYPPVMHYSGLPHDSLVGSVNGVLSAVLSYSGAQLFCEFLAEMRRPQDFLKALLCSQVFIIVVYLSYGSFVYYFQGQYTFQVSYQGQSIYAWQVVGDMIALLSGLIAAGLFGNIGIKILYNNVLANFFNAPPLYTKQGKIFWIALVPIWWSIAYIIAASIPAYFAFVGVMSAATLVPLTYIIPPLMALGYDIQLNAMKADAANGFDPSTGLVTRKWTGMQRWIKGYFAGGPRALLFNVWHTLYALAGLGLVGLGLYAAITAMKDAFKNPQVNAFVCNSPLFLAPS